MPTTEHAEQNTSPRQAERKKSFPTVSLEEINRLYDPSDVEPIDFDRDISAPGTFPYTRGIHSTGYRGKLWTMRQFAGFGTPEETNGRFKYLLKEGQTGLSVAYDLPALMGYDADSPFRKAKSANAAWPFRRSLTWRHCSTAFRSRRSPFRRP